MTDEVRVTVYTREVCPLCEDAFDVVDDVAERVEREVVVESVDVDDDPELREAYGDRVPYVFVDGTPAFKYRVDAAELERALRED